jgi:cytochrome o ubiquinol oxidase subunit 2|uniref:Ubiquinol oxidase polypeptide II n=1 Tax=Desulfobacca acetoxidans TaxID=60893 RepID=A0A7V6DPY8_9BACT
MQKKPCFLSAGLLFLAVTLFGGCRTIVLFNPKGPIGEEQRFVIIAAAVLMAIVVIPVFIMACWFSIKYRASNPKATYMPKWRESETIDLVMWGVPLAIVTVLAILAWSRTYMLDPYKPIPASSDPVRIEAVALDFKWLFIYPDYNIATVNEIVFPVQVPVSFRLTSDTVMTSFFIPQLGSQIYAMAGMQTRLHLLADQSGTFAGQNQQLSGLGYAKMFFKAHAVSPDEFQSWVQKVRQSGESLDLARYDQLIQPNEDHYPVTYFSAVKPGLFLDILRKYDPNWGKNPGAMNMSVLPPAAAGDAEGR